MRTKPKYLPESQKITAAEALVRFQGDDKRRLLVEAVKAAKPSSHPNWIGYVDWFAVAYEIGMNGKRSAAVARKFDELGIQESRNDGDGWITKFGLEVARLIDPNVNPHSSATPFATCEFPDATDGYLGNF